MRCERFSLTPRTCECASPKAGSPNLGDIWGLVTLGHTPGPAPLATSLSYL